MPIQGCTGGGGRGLELIPAATGREAGWVHHRPNRDKQPCALTLAPRNNLISPINLTCMFLDDKRNPEYPERIPACKGWTCKPKTNEQICVSGHKMTNKNKYMWNGNVLFLDHFICLHLSLF